MVNKTLSSASSRKILAHCNFLICSAAILLLLLTSCGFQVIYKDQEKPNSFAAELAAIRIKKERSKLDQQLKNNLYDVLNPDYLKIEPRYFLETKISSPLASSSYITSTGAAGRKRVLVNVSYILRNVQTMQIISQGSTEANDNYDVSSNRYGTEIAEDYIKTNLTKIIAQNVRNAIVNDLIETKRNCQNPPQKYFICPL